jgi:uracil-DNA glycosylase family 4
MSEAKQPPDRTTILASLRDYVEQLREEGMEGLPAAENGTAPGANARAILANPIGNAASPVSAVGAGRPQPSRENPPEPAKLSAGAPTEAGRSAAAAPIESLYRYAGLEKTLDLGALSEFIGDCQRCKLAPCRTNLVFGVGNPRAELMFVGEAPGADEDLRGEPFVGRAGQLLTDIIERGMGMTRAEVYICNVIKCRPPENRNPEPDEVAACEPFLFRQIDIVQPKVIVGLGTFAVQAVLKLKTPISKLRGVWHEVRGVKMMPTFHPAYLLRNPADKRLVWADIQEVMKVLGRTIPQRNVRS